MLKVKSCIWLFAMILMLFSPVDLFAEEFDPTGIYQVQDANACAMAVVEINYPMDNLLVTVRCWVEEVDLNTNYRRQDILLEGYIKNFEYEPFVTYTVHEVWDESGESTFAIKFYPEDGTIRIDDDLLTDTLLLGKNTVVQKTALDIMLPMTKTTFNPVGMYIADTDHGYSENYSTVLVNLSEDGGWYMAEIMFWKKPVPEETDFPDPDIELNVVIDSCDEKNICTFVDGDKKVELWFNFEADQALRLSSDLSKEITMLDKVDISN